MANYTTFSSGAFTDAQKTNETIGWNQGVYQSQW